ncbi:Arc/MetJ-type ribon-helix-helix transcriptional regulator [Desulfobaculum xiamenense]|uniref:Arc/MetJ-type ribon-helix-helix transcriptional regulator n=1 Tax=Desulfobaculum xiamenense TaxID=995050 RepID=A0A846QKW9_9BACT|nr:hypothetical protein [Desulfobaculum xiamenense]NJB66833.1 Arc/MetJ-type ribon-helix-helix transcriptional regulator [Desulfobaculum xiamenense]
MTTIMPDNELFRRAVRWIDEQRTDGTSNLDALIQEAAMRFNLGPKETIYLDDFFKKNLKKQDESPE